MITKKKYEAFLNERYGKETRDYYQAQGDFGYLVKRKAKMLYGGKVHPDIVKHYNARTLGTLLRKGDPVNLMIATTVTMNYLKHCKIY